MEAIEQVRIVGWRKLSRRYRFVVAPQRDREAVTLVDAWLHPRLRSAHRVLGFGEPLSKLDFELCVLPGHGRDPGNDVARHQTEDEPVRVVKNNRVVDAQVERCGRCHTRSHRTRNF